jgi:hypothetical protein
VKTADELASLFRQKTWDKDLVLWVGAESRLRELLGTVPAAELDLLDLFDPDCLPMDDDETRVTLQRNLRQALRGHAVGPGNRCVLLVRSVSLLARYHVGVRDFYEWFCNDFAMVVLALGRMLADPIATDEVVCMPDRPLQYFRAPDVVKQVYGEGG